MDEEERKFLREYAIRAFDRADQNHSSLISAAVESANKAIFAALLLNGFACVALLGFLSAVFAEQLDAGRQLLLTGILASLSWFAWGAFAAVVCAFLAYLINRAYALGITTQKRQFEHPYLVETGPSKKWDTAANILNGFGVLAGLFSLGCFIRGVYIIQAHL